MREPSKPPYGRCATSMLGCCGGLKEPLFEGQSGGLTTPRDSSGVCVRADG